MSAAFLFLTSLLVADLPSSVDDSARHSIFVGAFSGHLPVAAAGDDADSDVEAVSADTIEIIQGLVTAELARRDDVDVMSTREIRATLNDAAESAEGACTALNGCLTELVQALGADHLVVGNVSLSSGFLATELSLVDVSSGDALSREVILARDLASLASFLDDAVHNLMRPLAGGDARVIPAPESYRRFDDADSLWAMTAVGVFGGGAAALFSTAGMASWGINALPGIWTPEGGSAVFGYATYILYSLAPIAAAAMATIVTLVVDGMLGGEHPYWRALTVLAVTAPAAFLTSTLCIGFALIGFPIGWNLQYALDPNAEVKPIAEDPQSAYMAAGVTGSLGALVVMGPLVGIAAAAVYAGSLYVLEGVEPEGEILVDADPTNAFNTWQLASNDVE